MGTFNEELIAAELQLTKGEESLIAAAETGGGTPQANKVKMYSSIYSTKGMVQAIDKLIESNEMLSKSNDRYARAMNVLTAGLLVVAIIQVVVALLNR